MPAGLCCADVQRARCGHRGGWHCEEWCHHTQHDPHVRYVQYVVAASPAAGQRLCVCFELVHVMWWVAGLEKRCGQLLFQQILQV